MHGKEQEEDGEGERGEGGGERKEQEEREGIKINQRNKNKPYRNSAQLSHSLNFCTLCWSQFILLWCKINTSRDMSCSVWYWIRVTFNYYAKILATWALSAHLSNQKIIFEHTAKWNVIKEMSAMSVFRSVQFSKYILILYADISKIIPQSAFQDLNFLPPFNWILVVC